MQLWIVVLTTYEEMFAFPVWHEEPTETWLRQHTEQAYNVPSDSWGRRSFLDVQGPFDVPTPEQ